MKKTIEMSEYFISEVQRMAVLERRSFSGQTEKLVELGIRYLRNEREELERLQMNFQFGPNKKEEGKEVTL